MRTIQMLLHVGFRKDVEISCEQESGVVLDGCRKVIRYVLSLVACCLQCSAAGSVHAVCGDVQ